MLVRRLILAAFVSGLWQCAVPTVWALNLRAGVPEGNIEILFDVIVQQPLDPATEFSFIDLVPFDDGTGRMAVSTVQGTIRVIDAGGNLLSTPLLTKAQSALVIPQEAGMTGIAFHPDFNSMGTFGYGKLYTITTEVRSSSPGGVPFAQVDFPFASENYQDVIREWDLAVFGNVPGNAANNAFTGATANSREIMRVAQPGPFHNVVDLAFNTNVDPTDSDYGILYITAGDGGNPSGLSTAAGNTARAMGAQNLSTIYGNVLRIDPDPTANALVRTSARTGQPAYSIPVDNPNNGDDATETRTSSTLAEIWAHGFRSPWRLTFDRATGEMYIGDLGENAWEEVNRVEKGKNYGWGEMEGFHDSPPAFIAGDGTLIPGLVRPIFELPHDTASDSITGGFVYRGSAIPELVGKYVFADLGQNYDSSALFYAVVNPNDPDGNVGDVFEFKLSALSPKFENDTQALPERIFSIGEDSDGELYIIAGPDPRQPFVPSRPSLVIRLADAPHVPLLGDLNDDGEIDVRDWTLFKAGQGSNFMGITALEARARGDLDGDFDHDLSDFVVFRTIYEQNNGAGSFSALFARVPEPSSVALAIISLLFGLTVRRAANRR